MDDQEFLDLFEEEETQREWEGLAWISSLRISFKAKAMMRNFVALRRTRRVAQQRLRIRMHQWSKEIYVQHVYILENFVSEYPIDGWREALQQTKSPIVLELLSGRNGDEERALHFVNLLSEDVTNVSSLIEGLHAWAAVLEAVVMAELAPA